MIIAHVEEYFHPEAGYQINSLIRHWSLQGHKNIVFTSLEKDVIKEFRDFFDFSDLRILDDKFEKKYNCEIKRVSAWGKLSNRVLFKKTILNKINKVKPDVIYVHGNDTFAALLLLRNIEKINAPIIMDSHMQMEASKNRLNNLWYLYYRKKITPLVVKRNIRVIKTADVNFVNNQLGLPKSLTPYLGFGSDRSIFFPSKHERDKLRKSYKIPDNARVFIYAGKLTIEKGINIFISAITKKFEKSIPVYFFIVGNHNDVLISKKLEMVENNMIIKKTQKLTALADLFKLSDVSVFPKQNSLTFFDAQSSGLPCILENSKLNESRVGFNNGKTYMQNDSKALRRAIIAYIDMPLVELNAQKEAAIKYVQEKYDYAKVSSDYMDILIKVKEEYNSKNYLNS